MNPNCIGFLELKDTSPSWRLVRQLGTRILYCKGTRIQHNQELLFLEKGQVRLTHYTIDGMEKTLWYINEGCIFGETPLFDPMPPGRGVHICTKDCIVYVFTKEVVEHEMLTSHPELLHDLLRSLARKVRILSNHASSLYVDDVLIRACKFLGERVLAGSPRLTVRPGLSLQELANLLGVHRVTLYKVFRQQEEDGLWGHYNRKAIQILNPDRFYLMVNA